MFHGPCTLMRFAPRFIRLGLFLFGVVVCLHYGRYGFHALDQSIVFDGAWRVLSGQVPQRDFFSPIGLVPILMQAAVFKILGVTWFAYCLHAALLNGTFAVVAFNVLRGFGAPLIVGSGYGLLSAIYFYPPFGVPYPDQHAFFFSACLIYAAMRASQADVSPFGRRAWHASLPPLAVCALLSKPVPGVVAVAGVGAWIIWRGIRGPRTGLGILTASAAATIVLVIGTALVFRIPVRQAIYYGYLLPSGEMNWRIGNISSWKGLTGRHARVTGEMNVRSPQLIHFAGAVVLIAALWPGRRRSVEELTWSGQRWLMAEALFALTLLFVYLTNNTALNGLGLLPLSVGFAHTAALRWTRRIPSTWLRGASAIVVSLPFLVVTTFDAWRFNSRVNATRWVHDEVWLSSSPVVDVSPPLEFMRLNEAWRSHDFVDIQRFLQGRRENFLLIGDSAILYGATKRPSIFPVLWMHRGVTIPGSDSAEFDDLERRLIENMRRHEVQFIVLEGPYTWTGISLGSFPRVANAADGCETSTRGRWTIVEICHAERLSPDTPNTTQSTPGKPVP